MAPRRRSPLGAPTAPEAPQLSARDEAFARFVKADPEAAATMQRDEVKANYERLRNFTTLNDMGMQILAGVQDQEGYDRGRAQARALYARFGEDTSGLDQLPEQWTPEVSEQLRMQGMSTKEQLDGLVKKTRLQWDITDDELDNERADENQESMDDYREGQLGLARDRINVTRTDPRRVAPRSRQGGSAQPTPTNVIGRIMEKQASGAPLTPAEQQTLQEYRAPRGRGRAPAPSRAATAVGPDRRRIVVRNGKWVDAQTGRPVQ